MSFLCGIRWMKRKFVSSSPLTLIVFMLIVKLSTNGDNGIIGCDAAPSTSLVSSDEPSELALKRVADTHRVDNLTRQHGGDVFNANGLCFIYLFILFAFYSNLFLFKYFYNQFVFYFKKGKFN